MLNLLSVNIIKTVVAKQKIGATYEYCIDSPMRLVTKVHISLTIGCKTYIYRTSLAPIRVQIVFLLV